MAMTKKDLKRIAEMNEGVPFELIKEIAESTEYVLKNPDSVILPFDSEEFKELWFLYKAYRKQKGNKKGYTTISEQAALRKLSRLSEVNEEKALAIIEQTIEENWIGFFKLKEDGRKEKPVTDDYKQSILKDLYSD